MRISRISATEVLVPTHRGAISSPSLHSPLHSRPWQGRPAWSMQFDELPKVLLGLELADGTVGLGELYRGHDWSTVDALAGVLVGRDLRDLALQRLPLAAVPERDGFEMAVWDAYARAVGVRVVDLLGGPLRDQVLVNAWSGPRTPGELAERARTFLDAGFTTLKLKCSLADDVVGWCEVIADRAPGLDVVLDPNQRFERFADARRIGDAVARIGNVRWLEDPLPHWNLPEWSRLRDAQPVPLARHVSLAEPQKKDHTAVVATIRAGSADAFNVTAGLSGFQRVDHAADLAEMQTWHGSQVDLGVAEAAYVHSCAAAATCTMPSDIFGRLLRVHDLLREPLRVAPPHVALPEGPGLGVELDPEAVAEFTVGEREYTS